MTLGQRFTDFRSDDISVHHCRKKKRCNAERRLVHASASLCRSILSRLTNSKRTFCKVGRDGYTKKPGYTHTEIRCARVSHSISALCRPSLGCRARFHFSLSRERHPAVMRFSSTRQWASALAENHFAFPTSRTMHIYVCNHYNEPSAKYNYFVLLTRSPWFPAEL